MARIALIGGAYEARSVIANAQRCVNYFPEINRQDAPVPMTFYQRGGLRPLVSAAVPAPVRGLYRASNGQGYCVIGQNVYQLSPGFALTLLGALTVPGLGPVSMIDNGTTVLVVDGSALGYTIDLASGAFAQLVDPTGTFDGATRVCIIDTYTLWNMPGTVFFGSSLSGSLTFNALYFAGKVGYPDPLVVPMVNRNELILLGALKSEIWYDAGNAQFPFARLPGAYIEHGCVAPFSAATADISLFWLSRDLQGHGMVLELRGYDTRRVSNHALENAIGKMGNIGDAIGWTFQRNGHVQYVLTFPSGNQTWVYDASLGDDPTMAWHQEAWMGDNGLERSRANCGAFLFGQNVVGDWQNGTLYAVDEDYYVDTVGGQDRPIQCVRTFPHTLSGANLLSAYGQQVGAMADSNGHVLQYSNFKLDLDCGLGTDAASATVGLRVSLDRGHTWGNVELQPSGDPGVYLTQPQWRLIGQSRDAVFEISHGIKGPAALNGAWVDAAVLAK